MSTDFRLNSIFLPFSEVSISSLTSRTLMSFRSDRISQIPFQMPFHTCLSLFLSLSPCSLFLSCSTCILSPPKNYAMHGSVLFLFFFLDLLLLFPTAIDLCAPPHEPIYHGAACTVRYISHPYPSGHEILRLLVALSLSLSCSYIVYLSLLPI